MDIIDLFTADINKLSDKFIQNILRVISGAELPRAEMEVLIAQADFFLSNPQVNERLQQFLFEYDDKIVALMTQAKQRGIGNLNTITVSQIERLKELDFDFILKRGSMYEAELRSELFKQITEGISSKEITDNLLPLIQGKVTYAPNWFASALNTAYQEYNAALTESLFKGTGERFRLIGPDDIRTRPSCEAVLHYQDPNGYTIEEINKGAVTNLVHKHASEYAKNPSSLEQALKIPYTFVTRAGYNCRHNWELI